MAESLTPLMAQYHSIKKDHPDAILFFHLGDFYEMFYEDARTAHKVLGITLTGRISGDTKVPMAGVPRHSAQGYIARLMNAGHRVALCEQTEDPEDADGRIVDRAVVRVITPGTLLEEVGLEERRNNFLAAADWDGNRGGLAWIDVSTGSFQAEEVKVLGRLYDGLSRLAPAECLVREELSRELQDRISQAVPGTVRSCPAEAFSGRDAEEPALSEQARGCAAALLAYLKETRQGSLAHLGRVRISAGNRMVLDRNTIHALELVETARERKIEGSLLGVLDHCETSMGSRVLREWLLAPLLDTGEISARQGAVGELRTLGRELAPKLAAIGDLERLTGRLGSGRATPRDLGALREALKPLPRIKSLRPEASLVQRLLEEISTHDDLGGLLGRALADVPAPSVADGPILRPGFDAELDRLRELSTNARQILNRLAEREIARTGIASLKVGYTSVFGYYLEITNANASKVPPEYIRKQTLKNAERYITAELKELESQILNAEEESKRLEKRLFDKVRGEAAQHIPALQRTARALAELDALSSLGRTAAQRGYVRPEVDSSPDLFIEEGRHPVLDVVLERKLVANDLRLEPKARILLVTGPNMAGKSTYLRQAALLTLMAQIGSFLPAARARIGVADRIFTRIGASDEIARGVSTFMQEMIETATVLKDATDRSVVLLDELGRGTSTYDGLAIAWAVLEHLHEKTRSRTLFATHYHELVAMARSLSSVSSLQAGVKEWKDSIVFLYRIVPGAANKSYGIHVARLAGIPSEVVRRADLILRQLEKASARTAGPGETFQLGLFEASRGGPAESHPVLKELRGLDPDGLTPREALRKISEWKDAVQDA